MRFPAHVTLDMIRHQARNALKGNSRYPFVLMLEPLYTCNRGAPGIATRRRQYVQVPVFALEDVFEDLS